MKKVELLAPAGSYEALVAAVQNGADAIYMAGSRFGARAFAKNFDHAGLKEAITYAHTYGVKIYITVNTLIYDTEFDDVLAYVDDLVALHVDAIIVQDIGLMDVLQHRYPDLELHASTQMHIHNLEGFTYLKHRGIQRAVVARECTVEKIRQFAQVGIDLEVFVQGALCVSYSGQCLMSSYLKGRSGNKGECAQHCRMLYRLKENDKVIANDQYLLSPKDLNSIAQVPTLIEAGIHSFKLEGRMKRPEYVAQVVSMYRKAIDAYYANTTYQAYQDDIKDLKKIFNRDFTAGHLFGAMGSNLMNFHRPNHMGVDIGVVTKVTKDKITILLHDTLRQGDGIRIIQKNDEGFTVNRMYQNGLLVNAAHANEVIELDNKSFVERNARIVKTSDVQQLKQLSAAYLREERKVEITMEAQFYLGCPAMLTLRDQDGNEAFVQSDWVIEASQKQPMDRERIQAQLEKLGATTFVSKETKILGDDSCFISIKLLNELRRDAVESLTQLRLQRNVLIPNLQQLTTPEQVQSETVIIEVTTLAVYEALKDFDVCFWVSNRTLYEDLKLDSRVHFQETRVQKRAYETAGQAVVGEVGGLLHGGSVADYSFNVTNAHSLSMLHREGMPLVILSKECDLAQISQMMQKQVGANVGIVLYDYPELMIMEYCPINTVLRDDDKHNCVLCKQNRTYHLEDIHGASFLLQGDDDCMMHIASTKVHDRRQELSTLLELGVRNFVLRFQKESDTQMRDITQNVLAQLHKVI
ncbi:MAG: peptidase U32 family protein [Erysipelotrichaceae bacterium]